MGDVVSQEQQGIKPAWKPSDRASAGRYADCHIHSTLCGHAKHTLEEMLEAIRVSGLYGAIFTEHLPLPKEIDPQREVSMYPDALVPYVETLREAQAQFEHVRNKGGAPRLIVGAEADWLYHDPEWSIQSVEEARQAGADVILGSVHMLGVIKPGEDLLGHWFFDDPAQESIDLWRKSKVEDVWDLYFTEWIKAVKTGAYDVMAHPDLPKKFGFVPKDPREYYTQAAAAIAEAGILCELSTGGLRKPCKELYPSQDFLKELVRRGVGITLGSDAHSAGEIGYGFDYATQQLIKAGATHHSFPTGSICEGKVELLPL